MLLVCARLRHIAGKSWGAKRYMDMGKLARLNEESTDAETA